MVARVLGGLVQGGRHGGAHREGAAVGELDELGELVRATVTGDEGCVTDLLRGDALLCWARGAVGGVCGGGGEGRRAAEEGGGESC